MPTVRFTNRLQRHVDCPTAEVDGLTIVEVLDSYFSTHERVEGYVLDERKRLRTHMTIFVDGQPILDRENLQQLVKGDSVLDVIQALSGG